MVQADLQAPLTEISVRKVVLLNINLSSNRRNNEKFVIGCFDKDTKKSLR
jgi:hypothetical protein